VVSPITGNPRHPFPQYGRHVLPSRISWETGHHSTRVSERRRIAPRSLIESAILAAVTISSGLFVNALAPDNFDPSRAIPKAASFETAEQDFTAASILTTHEVDRLQELQLLDRLNGDTDSDGMVKKVLDS
jgi:hypothetical protein